MLCNVPSLHRSSAPAKRKAANPTNCPEDFTGLRTFGLTPRECEVLAWVAHGKRDAEIARVLGIARKTVSKHLEHLLTKLHAETRTGAVSAAQEHLRRLSR
jgi:DNA-binding CsgD family transcriptional regulator